jgi:hypothetical protein
MRPISEATARIAKQNFSKKYISLGRIIAHWDEIVGADFCRCTQPVKINYRKPKPGEKPSATLDIAAAGAFATTLHYRKDLILERINQIFGERWITGIRFVDLPTQSQAKSLRKAKKSLTEGEKTYLSSLLQDVQDQAVRERLERLGQAIIEDQNT